MRELLIGLLILFGVYYYYGHFIYKPSINKESSGDEMVFHKAEESFVFKSSPEFQLDLRVFGYNENRDFQNLGPLALASHLFIATPLNIHQNVMAGKYCEIASVREASMISIIAQDKSVRNEIQRQQNLKSDCVRLTCQELTFKQFLKDGKPIAFRLEPMAGGGVKFRADKYLLVSAIEPVSCR